MSRGIRLTLVDVLRTDQPEVVSFAARSSHTPRVPMDPEKKLPIINTPNLDLPDKRRLP